MTLNDFKNKHKDLINKGIITFARAGKLNLINIDRFHFESGEFMCEAKELIIARADARKLGYTLRGSGVGCYGKER